MEPAAVDNLPARARPRRFGDVIGSRAAKTVLRSAAAAGAPPSAILLSGGSGTGKTTLARIFAAGLFCAHTDDGDPCGVCDVCVAVSSRGGHPDLVEVDAASSGGVDAVRDLAARAALTPAAARWRIHIIDEAHGLTKEGAGAFLKLLEEPPSTALFILATTDPHKLPSAIRGRCVHLPVSGATHADLLANLRRVCDVEGWVMGEEDLATIVDVTDPELGVRGTVANLAAARSIGGDVADALGAAPAGAVAAILDAASDRSTVETVAGVETLLASYPVAVLSTQLTSAARRRLAFGLNGDTDAALNHLHVWKSFACAPETAAGLLLAAAAAARGDLTTPDSVASLTDMALAAGDRLVELLADVEQLKKAAAAAAPDKAGAQAAPRRKPADVDAEAQAAEQARAAAEQELREAEEQARLDAERDRQEAQQAAAAGRARHEAEEQARRDQEQAAAAEQARLAAEQAAAEEKARHEAEEQARREQEQAAAAAQARLAAEQAAAEDKARRDQEQAAAEKARLAAEQARVAAEQEAADEQARLDAQARRSAEGERRHAEEQTRRAAEQARRQPLPAGPPATVALPGTANLPSRTAAAATLDNTPTITLTVGQLASIAERSPAAAAYLSQATLKSTPPGWTLTISPNDDDAIAAAAAQLLTDAGRPTRTLHVN